LGLTDEGDGIVVLVGREGHTEDTFQYFDQVHNDGSAIVRYPDLGGELISVFEFLENSPFLWFFVGLPGRSLGGGAFPGNGITPEQVLGGSGRNRYYALADWYESDWFGFFNTTFDPWIFHGGHGFIYLDPLSVTDDDLFFYDSGMQSWWWTGAGVLSVPLRL
jgi:hypothetical protein